MKQVFHTLKTGKTEILEIPGPVVRPGSVLVRNAASVVSAGTERMLVEFSGKSWLGKARSRPDLVRQVLDKARRDGIVSTIQATLSRLEDAVPLGYSSAGRVLEVGGGVTGFAAGDLVACAGAGYACHAELVCVPANLVVRVEDGVAPEAAAFGTLGAIAMHGFRLAELRLGETVAVLGLGLVGQLTAQLALAAGCRVIAMDPNRDRCRLAARDGRVEAAHHAAGIRRLADRVTDGAGCDAVLITAATTSSEPVALAGEIARDRGRVIAVGAVGLEIPRKPYFGRELEFRVSRSYGPGRYDASYEEEGHDYPIGYVRWTERRNLEAFQKLLAQGSVRVEPLISHRFDISEAGVAYELLEPGNKEPSLGVVLRYPDEHVIERRLETGASPVAPARPDSERIALGVIGAGAFARNVLLPELRKVEEVDLVGVCTSSGRDARQAADRFGFAYCASDVDEILQDEAVDTVAVLTRHDSHAAIARRAIEAGKRVFIEKPPALNQGELADILESLSGAGSRDLMVGYNRRYSPLAGAMRDHFAETGEPIIVSYRINARHIPREHWVHDPRQGGGRIIGEAGHFVDLIQFLAGSTVTRVWSSRTPNAGRYSDDNVVASLDLANGSLGTIIYAANGAAAVAKERIEVFGGGRVARLDDFRRLTLDGAGRRRVMKRRRQAKGFREEWRAFAAGETGSGVEGYLEGIVATSLATFAIVESVRSGEPVAVDAGGFIAGR